MTEGEAILTEVLKNPEDTATRLILADWLFDNNQETLSTIIRHDKGAVGLAAAGIPGMLGMPALKSPPPAGVLRFLYHAGAGPVILTGARGVGKTTAAFLKMHFACLCRAGINCIVFGRQWGSISRSGGMPSIFLNLLTAALEPTGLPAGFDHGDVRYQNGSQIVWCLNSYRAAGIDCDMIFCADADRLGLFNWHTLWARAAHGCLIGECAGPSSSLTHAAVFRIGESTSLGEV